MNGSNMENGRTPLYVAFSTQKGGVGKTTFTVLAASYLHYLKGYDVAVDAQAGCRNGVLRRGIQAHGV